VLNQVAHRAKEGGHDSVGLGRWAYVRLQGRKLKTIGGDDPSGSMMKVNEAVRRPISRDLVEGTDKVQGNLRCGLSTGFILTL